MLITNGAYESLFDAISAFVNEGDEVGDIHESFNLFADLT